MRRVLSLGIGAGVVAGLVSRPALCRESSSTLSIEALSQRVSMLETLARVPPMMASAAQGLGQEPKIIDGKSIAADIRLEVKGQVDDLKSQFGVVPGLAVVLVGERTDSATYVRMKKRAADECGFFSVDRKFNEDVTQQQLIEEIRALNSDPKVHAILVQLPLPRHVDESAVLEAIDVSKDVDGFSAVNIGNMCLRGGRPPLAVPCTPAGCVELLQRSGVEVRGKNVVVIGRSNIVGMPVAHLLMYVIAA